jgi:site-specific DNA-methyltransferase (adenine-specific)
VTSINKKGVKENDVWPIPVINSQAKERLGYPTQKPEALLEKIIAASSNENDLILDAYGGCGTTISVAERFKRRWIGIDITYQSISLILRRLEGQFGKGALQNITLNGIPQDMESAYALANKQDDRVRKEFEKWAVLTYTNNRAIINEKKGADAGIDGMAYFQTSATENAKMVLQVKSGGVGRGDIAKLRGDMAREGAEMATLITLESATEPMRKEAKAAGLYPHPLMLKNYDRIKIVTVKEIIEENRRLELPMNLEVLKKAQAAVSDNQLNLIESDD